jgi:hypothetical protein
VSREAIEAAFPALVAAGYEITSPATHAYNCIAYAVGDHEQWWWPDSMGVGYWPPHIPREESIAAFLEAFCSLGYEMCADASFTKEGFDKIALYAIGETPTHAARMDLDGHWTSKLGPSEDIRHDLADLEGEVYGKVTCYLQRPMEPVQE